MPNPRFWLARFPVTNAEYARFIEAKGYQARTYWSDEGWNWLELGDRFDAWFQNLREQDQGISEAWKENFRPGITPLYWQNQRFNHQALPIVGINAYEVEAYCAWLNQKGERTSWWPKGYRITVPTEAQWAFAARGPEGRLYPWGDEGPNRDRANYHTMKGTTPVGAFPAGATPGGARRTLYDMAGNCWEWCLDRNAQEKTSFRIVKGGSWSNPAWSLDAATRNWIWSSYRNGNLGFRCCLAEQTDQA